MNKANDWRDEIFTYDKVVPAKAEAIILADAVVALMEAQVNLVAAIKTVPKYTGDCCAQDYYATEQEAWNRAADKLYTLLSK